LLHNIVSVVQASPACLLMIHGICCMYVQYWAL